jgi:hypothetical protein
LGRWLRKDPINEEGGFNLYLFVHNNTIGDWDELGLISSKEALLHFKNGKIPPKNPKYRKPLKMTFSEINTDSVKVGQFPQVKVKLSKCEPGTYQIKWSNSNDNLPFSTSGDQALFLGNISLKLTGTLIIKADKSWSFNGTLKSFDDLYDFNKSTHRGFIGECLTAMGRNTKGKPFWIEIRGSKKISEKGCCSVYDTTSTGGNTWYY